MKTNNEKLNEIVKALRERNNDITANKAYVKAMKALSLPVIRIREVACQ